MSSLEMKETHLIRPSHSARYDSLRQRTLDVHYRQGILYYRWINIRYMFKHVPQSLRIIGILLAHIKVILGRL